jgi:DNA-directed RNA polymerase III subunit RPC1
VVIHSLVARFFLQAQCPIQGRPVLSPSEMTEIVRERLSQEDASIASGCSELFNEKLAKFLQNEADAVRQTRQRLGLTEKTEPGEEDSPAERAAASIRGWTARQLQIFLDTCIRR